MDLSVQKMQPPATVKGKSAAKKTDPSGSDDAVETISRDQTVHMGRGNAGYEEPDPDERHEKSGDDRERRRKNRQLLSREDLTELTESLEAEQQNQMTSDGLMHLRAYTAQPKDKDEEERPHFEVNI
ncbi:hypothetical protein SAMN04515647_4599 [Cohaesibacter sp. ES.047]|uniref:hypothetical protein n=1 Tax=Cohaesibacter sp. ES.047 TaxID=1798205 RepID=UPI000BB742F7|nr:hypothetical protein [Cohaesibacter sp. ES.047]SNY94277.1 hypothetical protein SAMN04515647_4599 [Cohaesibacter sp. ES.047]